MVFRFFMQLSTFVGVAFGYFYVALYAQNLTNIYIYIYLVYNLDTYIKLFVTNAPLENRKP